MLVPLLPRMVPPPPGVTAVEGDAAEPVQDLPSDDLTVHVGNVDWGSEEKELGQHFAPCRAIKELKYCATMERTAQGKGVY